MNGDMKSQPCYYHLGLQLLERCADSLQLPTVLYEITSFPATSDPRDLFLLCPGYHKQIYRLV